MDVTVVESVTKTIGSLALAYPYLRRLNVAEMIDALTITGKEWDICSHGPLGGRAAGRGISGYTQC